MGRIPSYQRVCGLPMPAGFPVDALESAFDFVPNASDIVLATYPKCGTTWMQHILYMLQNQGRAIDDNSSVRELVPHLEEMGAEFVGELPAPRLIKTHLAASDRLFSEAAKYVLVFRNPFDCVVSFFHHTRGFVRHYDFADGTFEDFLPLFLAGEVDFGDYFANVRSWLDVSGAKNVLMTTYERMHANLGAEVRRVGVFLGGSAARAVADDDTLGRIVDAASFGSMARGQQRWSSQRPKGMTAFVRKGIVGDWRAHFTPETARALLARTEAELAGSVLLDEWAEIIEAVRLFCATE